MRGSGIRDDVAPWSFFLPVTLAVIVGVLAAGLIQRGIDIVFADGDRGEVAATAAGRADVETPKSPAADTERQAVPASRDTPAAEAMAVPDASVALPEELPDTSTSSPVEPVQADTPVAAIPVLPGAVAARRDGAPEACINGSIALRDANGWQQLLENDAPVPCTEESSAPRQGMNLSGNR